MRYAVLGAGAVGSGIGAHLFLAGQPVVLIDPSPARTDAIRREGLRLSIKGDDGAFRPAVLNVPAAYEAKGQEPADVIVLCTKSIYNASALENIRALWKEDSVLLTCQNGADTLEALKGALPMERTAVGVVYFGGRVEPDGTVISLMGGDAHLLVGDGNPVTRPVLERMAGELRATGFGLKLCPQAEFAAVFWKKLILNVVAGSLCALLRISNDRLGAAESGVALSIELARECCAVARAADGVDLAPEDIPLLATQVTPVLPDKFQHYPSMAADAMAGRRTENEFFAGAVCRLARRHGVETPRLRMLYELCRLMEDCRGESNR